MKKTTQFLCIAMSLLFAMNAKSQNVGIGTPTPNSSALLEVKSTNKGILIPQVSLASLTDVATIAAPATGLLVFNTNAGLSGGIGYYYNAGTTTSANWLKFQTGAGGGGSGWALTGNAGTDGTVNFLGTNDAQPLVFHVNGGVTGVLGTAGNVAIGRGAAGGLTSSQPGIIAYGDSAMVSVSSADSMEIAIGNSALYSNSIGANGSNTAIGNFSMIAATQAQFNVGVGDLTLLSNDTGYYNVAIGYAACYSTVQEGNTAVGALTLSSDATGIENTAIGNEVLASNTDGFYNTGVGSIALLNVTTGFRNTAVGRASIPQATTGYRNNGFGYYTLFGVTTGFKNIAIGAYAGRTITTGSLNILIGDSANTTTGTFTNAIAIGNGASVNASNKVVLGNTSATSIGGQVGWSTFSDGRYKKDIVENVKGLDFIMELRPVTYEYDFDKINNQLYGHNNTSPVSENLTFKRNPNFAVRTGKKLNFKEGIRTKKGFGTSFNDNLGAANNGSVGISNPNEGVRFTGFIAQEVEAAAKKTGFDFSGVDKPTNENGNYALRYAEFVVPLVKAVQEQQAIIDAQNKKIDDLVKRLEKLEQK